MLGGQWMSRNQDSGDGSWIAKRFIRLESSITHIAEVVIFD